VLDGAEIVYISRASTTRIMAINIAVGTRLPAVHTSMGRVLLASISDERLSEILDRIDMTRLTDLTITDRGQLGEIIARTRQQGWAAIDQELEIGVRSIAVPVRNHRGEVVASINASAHASRVSMKILESDFLQRLRLTAAGIEQDLAAQRGFDLAPSR
jgi:IclR family pca regulon transcriptional regulator